MNIVVCIKQVPGTSNVEVDPITGVLKRDGVESKLNPYDLFALELAFSLKKEHGGTISVVTMGPPQSKDVLSEAIYMGADDGVLISDRKFAGADVLATSYTLIGGIKDKSFDLIICGKQTTDGDTAQVGPEMAEFLNLDHAANVVDIFDVKDGFISVKMNLETSVQTQRMKLPCLLCVDKDINVPRLPSFKRKLLFKDADIIKVLSFSDFKDQDESNYGLSGSPTQVERIFPPDKNTSQQIFEGSSEELSNVMLDLLQQGKFI